MLYWGTSLKDVTSLLPPLRFFTRNEVFRYSTWTLTCSGLAKTPAASSSSNLFCNSSRVFLLYCGSLPFRWGGRVGQMLTTASIFPLAPFYLEMERLNTSSNSRLRAVNLSRVTSSRHPSGSRITRGEKGLQVAGEGETALHVEGGEVEDSTGRICRSRQSCSPLFRRMGGAGHVGDAYGMIHRLNLLQRRPRLFWFAWHVRRAVQPGAQGPTRCRSQSQKGH